MISLSLVRTAKKTTRAIGIISHSGYFGVAHAVANKQNNMLGRRQRDIPGTRIERTFTA
jgi:thiamine biosynthesis protein ThiC